MHIVTAHNPAYLQLVGVNPSRRRKRRKANMAARRTRRRRTTTRRANPIANPSRRTTRRRRRNPRVIVARNPRRRSFSFRRRSRRNPALGSVKGLFTGAVFIAGGVIATQFASGFIPVLPFGNWGVIAAKAGVAYGIGMVAHRLGVSQQNATLITLGGLAGVVQDAFALVRNKFPDLLQAKAVTMPNVPVAAAPQPAAMPMGKAGSSDYFGDGVSDIAIWGGGARQDLWGRGSGMGDVVLFGRQ